MNIGQPKPRGEYAKLEEWDKGTPRQVWNFGRCEPVKRIHSSNRVSCIFVLTSVRHAVGSTCSRAALPSQTLSRAPGIPCNAFQILSITTASRKRVAGQAHQASNRFPVLVLGSKGDLLPARWYDWRQYDGTKIVVSRCILRKLACTCLCTCLVYGSRSSPGPCSTLTEPCTSVSTCSWLFERIW